MNACTIYVMASNGLESIHQFCPLINFVLDFINLGLAKLLQPQDAVRSLYSGLCVTNARFSKLLQKQVKQMHYIIMTLFHTPPNLGQFLPWSYHQYLSTLQYDVTTCHPNPQLIWSTHQCLCQELHLMNIFLYPLPGFVYWPIYKYVYLVYLLK